MEAGKRRADTAERTAQRYMRSVCACGRCSKRIKMDLYIKKNRTKTMPKEKDSERKGNQNEEETHAETMHGGEI